MAPAKPGGREVRCRHAVRTSGAFAVRGAQRYIRVLNVVSRSLDAESKHHHDRHRPGAKSGKIAEDARPMVQMRNRIVLALCLAAGAAMAQTPRWTASASRQWYATQPWLVGANYTPATAINEL